MKISDRLVDLIRQQLVSFQDEDLEFLVVYVTEKNGNKPPNLVLVGQWPIDGKRLPPVEADRELRVPSPNRRWYPLQEGQMLLGVLRAERSLSSSSWSSSLDRRLKATALALTNCLSLEIETTALNEELQQQREQIGLMVHQLRNPLTALRTYAQLLLRRLGSDSLNAGLVEGLLSEQAQLNRYVSALDQISQPKLPLEFTSTTPLLLPPLLPGDSGSNVKAVLTPLIERAEATATLQGRKWNAPKEWPNWTEKTFLFQEGYVAEVVANLLENAFRYSPKVSPIGLLINEDGICVWDEGKPISEEEREKIFRRGYRGEKSSDKAGSGLGLSLAKELADKLGGSLELVNSPEQFDASLPQKGNAFLLKLPIDKSP